MTQVATKKISSGAHVLQWGPHGHYLAIGSKRGNGLVLWQWNSREHTLIKINSVQDITRVSALTWEPHGRYLAVGQRDSQELSIYPVRGGVFGDPWKKRFVQMGWVTSLDWNRKDDAMWGKHLGTDKVYKPHPKGKIPEDWWPINPLNANDSVVPKPFCFLGINRIRREPQAMVRL